MYIPWILYGYNMVIDLIWFDHNISYFKSHVSIFIDGIRWPEMAPQ